MNSTKLQHSRRFAFARTLIHGALILLLFNHFAIASDAPEVLSPRLAGLLQTPTNQPQAISTFWKEVAANGTPLIEPVPGDKSSAYYTFLWRAAPDHEGANIGISSSFLIPTGAVKKRMTRLGKTNIWYHTERLPAVARFSYYLVAPQGFHPAPEAIWRISYEKDTVYEFFVDPLGRHSYQRMEGDGPESAQERWFEVSYAQGPDAPHEYFLEPPAAEQRGTLEETLFQSEVLDNQRKITVYLPHSYQASAAEMPFLVLFDREQYVSSIDTPLILDNLISRGALPPMVAVLVGNAGVDTRRDELPPNQRFQEFLAQELIPWLRARYRLTSDPAQTVVAGSSLGGLAAAYTAYSHPEIFGNVISQSGSYWWAPGNDEDDDRAANREVLGKGWLQKLFAEGSKRNIRFYQDVGIWEGDGMILPNREFNDILKASGYPVVYREFVGGHDYLNWRATLVDGLLVLFGTEEGENYLHPGLARLAPD